IRRQLRHLTLTHSRLPAMKPIWDLAMVSGNRAPTSQEGLGDLEMNVIWRQCGRFWAFLPVILAGGCQTFPLPRPIVALVRDAEPQAPLSEVELQVVYPVNSPPVAADQRVGATTVDGIAALPVVPCGDRSVLVKATRSGYLPEDAALTAAFLRSVEPAHWWNATEQRPNFTIDMYSQPQFTVELVVPNGYRGLITADIQIDELPASNAQPLFRHPLPPS